MMLGRASLVSKLLAQQRDKGKLDEVPGRLANLVELSHRGSLPIVPSQIDETFPSSLGNLASLVGPVHARELL